MAITHICGFESGGNLEGVVLSGNVSVISTTVHSGGFAGRIAPVAGGGNWLFRQLPAGGTALLKYMSATWYMRVLQLPDIDATQTIGVVGFGGNTLNLYLNSTGTLRVDESGAGVVTSTLAFTVDGLWHRVEWDNGWNTGTKDSRVFVDGTQWLTKTTSASGSPVAGNFRIGGSTAATTELLFDDIVFHDGPLNGARATNYSIVLLKSVSDNARGANWTGGAGGTTSLFDALNNTPPIGVGAASDTDLTQIKNPVKDATGNYDANCTSYTTAGIGAGDTIEAVQSIVNHGFSATGTQLSGAVVIVSNPSGQTEQSFDFGDNSPTTAMGTYPTGWANMVGPVTESPSVTLGTQPVVRVGRRTASKTTECDACFLGINVMYAPATAHSDVPPTAARRQPFRSMITR